MFGTPASDAATRPEPEIHALLLWSNALPRADDILSDIRSRFRIVEVFSIEWSREHFADNLTRFYGQTLEPGSDKEVHCGAGPFLLVVVEDPEPTYGSRRTTRGRVTLNVQMFDAKKRYRRWTGGGHRIHATVNRREADKDLFLLLGRRAASYDAPGEWDGTIVTERRDLLGATGWQTLAELLAALEVVTGYVDLGRSTAAAAGADGRASRSLLVDNQWWAARIANGAGQSDALQHVVVADDELRLALSEVGDGSLDASWQHALMVHAVRDVGGLLVPSPVDRFYLTLHDVASTGLELSRVTLDDLDRLAQEHLLPRGDYGDPLFAGSARDAYLAQLAPPPTATPPRKRRLASPAQLARLVRRKARAASR